MLWPVHGLFQTTSSSGSQPLYPSDFILQSPSILEGFPGRRSSKSPIVFFFFFYLEIMNAETTLHITKTIPA